MNLLGTTKATSSFVKLNIFGTESPGGQELKKDDILEQKNGHKYSHTCDRTPVVSRCRKFLAVFLTILAITAERVVNSHYLRRSKCHVFCYWLESCVIVLFFTVILCKARNFPSGGLRLAVSSMWSFLPLVGLYVVYTAIDGNALNVFRNSSGGSEIHQVGLAISPVVVLVGMWWTSRDWEHTRDKLFLMVVGCSILLVVVFCSESDVYIQYYFSIKTALFGITFGCSLGLFSVILWQQVHSISSLELVFYLNCGCVILLPIAFLLTGELSFISNEPLLRESFPWLLITLAQMALLRLLHLGACLNQITVTSPLVYIATANASWLVYTLVITFAFKMELLLSTFEAFWIVGINFFVTMYCHFTHKQSNFLPNGQIQRLTLNSSGFNGN